MAGFATSWAIWLAGLTAGAQFVGMLLSSLYIEKLGRRTLLLSSLAVVVLSLVTVGAQTTPQSPHHVCNRCMGTDRMVHVAGSGHTAPCGHGHPSLFTCALLHP
jgi:MFS family permease